MNQKTSHRKEFFLALLSVLLLILIDQATKYLAVKKLKGRRPFVLIPHVFELQYLENRGAAFGVLQGQKWLFLLLTVFFLAALTFAYVRIAGKKRFIPLQILVFFLYAGAIGNMIDRIRHNYVVDFFYFSLIDFPVFNMADIYITVSCMILLILFLFYYKEEDISQIFSVKRRKSDGEKTL